MVFPLFPEEAHRTQLPRVQSQAVKPVVMHTPISLPHRTSSLCDAPGPCYLELIMPAWTKLSFHSVTGNFTINSCERLHSLKNNESSLESRALLRLMKYRVDTARPVPGGTDTSAWILCALGGMTVSRLMVAIWVLWLSGLCLESGWCASILPSSIHLSTWADKCSLWPHWRVLKPNIALVHFFSFFNSSLGMKWCTPKR